MRRVLIDECVNPRLAFRLRSVISEASIATVQELGWVGERDHVLIQRIQDEFDVFVTIDRGFEFEHNVGKLAFGIIVVETSNNQMPSYERVLDELVREIQSVVPGRVAWVRDPRR